MLGPGQVCVPHLHVPIWKRFIVSFFGVVVALWWPFANLTKAGAGIHEVEAVVLGTGIVFTVVACMSVGLSILMDEEHLLKYFLSGAGLPALCIGLINVPQVIG
jgi:hypothetical protein